MTTPLTKGQRREQNKLYIVQEATRMGFTLDWQDRESLLAFLIRIMNELGLEASVNPKNGMISWICVDDNGYRTGRVQRHLKKNDIIKLTKEMLEYLEMGNIPEPGNLRNINVSPPTREILRKTLGETWPEILSEKIRSIYRETHRSPKNYIPIAKSVAFKIVDKKIMVSVTMGEVTFKNDHIVIRNMILPESMRKSVEGTEVGKIVGGIPYGVLATTRINKAEQMSGGGGNSTLVLTLEHRPESI